MQSSFFECKLDTNQLYTLSLYSILHPSHFLQSNMTVYWVYVSLMLSSNCVTSAFPLTSGGVPLDAGGKRGQTCEGTGRKCQTIFFLSLPWPRGKPLICTTRMERSSRGEFEIQMEPIDHWLMIYESSTLHKWISSVEFSAMLNQHVSPWSIHHSCLKSPFLGVRKSVEACFTSLHPTGHLAQQLLEQKYQAEVPNMVWYARDIPCISTSSWHVETGIFAIAQWFIPGFRSTSDWHIFPPSKTQTPSKLDGKSHVGQGQGLLGPAGFL